MNRDEFLQGLQNALSGEVPPEVVRDNLRYYDDYIRTERQKGRAEAEILEELGDPRLIARTIIDTTPGAGSGGFAEYRGGIFGGSRPDTVYTEYDEDASHTSGGGSYQGPRVHYFDLSKWYYKLAVIAIVILVVTFLIAIVGGILTLLVPLLPGLVLIWLIFWLMSGGRGRR